MLREPKFLCLCFQTLFNPLLTILMWLFLIIWKQPWPPETNGSNTNTEENKSSQHPMPVEKQWASCTPCSKGWQICWYTDICTSLVISMSQHIYFIHISLSLSLSLGLIMARHLTITSVTSPFPMRQVTNESNKLTLEWLALHLGALPS